MSDPSQYSGFATSSGSGRRAPNHDNGASTALVLGIVSLFCAGIITGPIAFVMGRNAQARIRASNGTLEGEGLARAGMILGAIGTLGNIVGIYLLSTGAIVI